MSNYESLFTHTADAMCELDTFGNILRSNPACKLLLGPTMPPTGGSIFELFDAAAREELSDILKKLQNGAATGVVEGQLPQMQIWTSWHLTSIAGGQIVAVGRDISIHHKTAAALASKSSFLHSIIEAEPECVKLVSRTGELLDMNRAGLAMIGAPSRDHAVGQSAYQLIAPEDRERFVEFNDRVCKGENGELSFDIIGMDGTRRSMETVAVPLQRSPDGEILHLAITRDVSQRRALETQLHHARKMDAIGQMAGGIAHDFNNLLTAIIGPAELALLKVDQGSSLADDLRQIHSTGQRAARLTKKLLAFARREQSELALLSLPRLIHNMHDLLEHLLGSALDLDIDVDVPHVRADRVQLEQLLLNLTLNARDAIQVDGRVRIQVEAIDVTVDHARRAGCTAGPHIAMSVSDDGSGIDPQHLPKIFDPFFTTKAPGAGTGLGLSTCYGIVMQLGGAIEAQSVPEHGTTFTVLLPTQSQPTDEPLVIDPPGRGETILVVDDEPVVRKAVCRMLETTGFRVHACSGADEAIKLADGLKSIDLLVTDMTMLGMSGRDLASLLQARRPGLPVLYTTGYLPNPLQPEDKAILTEAEILLKPFTSHILSDAVLRAIGRTDNQVPKAPGLANLHQANDERAGPEKSPGF